MPNAGNFSFSGGAVQPENATQYELGVKSISSDKKLSSSLAVFDIKQQNVAVEDTSQARRNTDVLPRIAPPDVSRTPRRMPAIQEPEPGLQTVTVASNGISYATAFHDVSDLPPSDWHWLSLYSDIAPQLGVGGFDHAEASAWRRSLVSSFAVYVDALMAPGQSRLTTRLAFFASALGEDKANIAEVIRAWTQGVRFDDLERMAYLVRASAEEKRQNLTEAAGRYASLAAAAPFSEKVRFEHEVEGLPALAFWSHLRILLQKPAGVEQIAARLKDIHQRLQSCPRTIAWCGTEADIAGVKDLLPTKSGLAAPRPLEAIDKPDRLAPSNSALMTTSQVNHCHMAWPVPGMRHPDAAALAVAAELMSHQILHNRLREKGGAYGGSASYSAEDGVFTMNSFRDPRLAATYADFRAAVDEVSARDFSREALEEAIIAVIARLDRPSSPYGEAMEALKLQQLRVTPSLREEYRRGVLDCTIGNVKAAVQCWLADGTASRAAAVGRSEGDLAGMEAVDLAAAMA